MTFFVLGVAIGWFASWAMCVVCVAMGLVGGVIVGVLGATFRK